MLDLLEVVILTTDAGLESKSSLESAKHVYQQLIKTIPNTKLLLYSKNQWYLLASGGAEFSSNKITKFEIARISQNALAIVISHGDITETGHIQGYLNLLGISYIGPSLFTASITNHKFLTKNFLSSQGVLVPKSLYFDKDQHINYDNIFASIVFPCVVKPVSLGSGIGIHLTKDPHELSNAIQHVQYDLNQDVLIEEFIAGRELTVAGVIRANDHHILPIVEVMRRDSPELHSKYGISFTDRKKANLILNPELTPQLELMIKENTIRISKLLKCEYFFRIDYILDGHGNLHFLEINTIPGMAENSVFNLQLQASNSSICELFLTFIEDYAQSRTLQITHHHNQVGYFE